MDEPCSFEELRACLRSIASVNRVTRAYAPTLGWLERVLAGRLAGAEPVHIVDVGCGYGDMLRRIERWARGRGHAVRLTGIDLNPDAVRAAREATVGGGIEYVAGDVFGFAPDGGIDAVVSSLMAHHLEDCRIAEFIRWMERSARVGWFVSDLHRQAVPYHVFRAVSRMTGWHRFAKHDGPVSILRSFRREDWMRLCGAAGVEGYELEEWRPARLCVGRVK